MEISDVRVKLIEDANDRLRAVCSVTFDEQFVVRDVKVVDGTNGLFVAMPSRKLSIHCPGCRHKNHLRARFCNECGAKLPSSKASTDANGRVRLHRDIAHPINPTFREMVQLKVIESYKSELEASRLPGYKPVGVEEEEESMAEPTVERLSDPVEVTQEMTEYDALIAGLKPGGASRSDSDRGGRPPQQRSQRPPAPREAQRSGNERQPGSDSRGRSSGGRPGQEPRRDRGGDRPGSRPPRGPAPVDPQRDRTTRETVEPVHYEFADDIEVPAVATAPPPAPKPAPPPPRREAPPREVRRSEAPPAPRETRRSEAPPAPRETRRPEPAPAPAPPRPAAPADDDGDSFGAGIL